MVWKAEFSQAFIMFIIHIYASDCNRRWLISESRDSHSTPKSPWSVLAITRIFIQRLECSRSSREGRTVNPCLRYTCIYFLRSHVYLLMLSDTYKHVRKKCIIIIANLDAGLKLYGENSGSQQVCHFFCPWSFKSVAIFNPAL